LESLLRQVGLALFAGEFAVEVGGTALLGEDPFAERPRWVMADVLGVAAFELSDPVTLIILVEGDDSAEDRHGRFDYRVRCLNLNRYGTPRNDMRAPGAPSSTQLVSSMLRDAAAQTLMREDKIAVDFRFFRG
jgi:hypothetical protein